jgi:hypothetical protein
MSGRGLESRDTCIAGCADQCRSMHLMLEVGQFAVRLHYRILDAHIHIAGALARILGTIAYLLQIVNALAQLAFILRLHGLVRLSGFLVQLLHAILQVGRHAAGRLTSLCRLMNGLFDVLEALLNFSGLHHD